MTGDDILRDDVMVAPTPPCPLCGNRPRIEVRRADFQRWQGGAYMQEAFPEMPPERREQLLTGYCPDCWDKMVGDE